MAIDLLGGAKRRKPRVRGFADWRPRPDTVALLDLVRAILDEYAAYLPLTLRQIFYRLVGVHDYPKTEQGYARLGEHLSRARRAQLIPMADIRDDGGVREGGRGWPSVEAYLSDLRARAEYFRLDRTLGQSRLLVVVCEAAGMVPQLARVTDPYDIEVISSGGFESLTEQHNFGRQAAEEGRLVEFLDIGDHDASGTHRYLSLFENIDAFAGRLGGEVKYSRLAVTPTQIVDLGLPTAPPKLSDRRAFSGETTQVEAIAPDVLADILRDAILARLDHDAYQRVLDREAEDRARLARTLSRL